MVRDLSPRHRVAAQSAHESTFQHATAQNVARVCDRAPPPSLAVRAILHRGTGPDMPLPATFRPRCRTEAALCGGSVWVNDSGSRLLGAYGVGPARHASSERRRSRRSNGGRLARALRCLAPESRRRCAAVRTRIAGARPSPEAANGTTRGWCCGMSKASSGSGHGTLVGAMGQAAVCLGPRGKRLSNSPTICAGAGLPRQEGRLTDHTGLLSHC